MPATSSPGWRRSEPCSSGSTDASVAVLLGGAGRANLDDQVAIFERFRLRLPEAVGEPAAINPEASAAARQIVERAADFLGLHRPFDQLHPPVDCSELGPGIA